LNHFTLPVAIGMASSWGAQGSGPAAGRDGRPQNGSAPIRRCARRRGWKPETCRGIPLHVL